jgi:hypothetical protein
MTWVRRSAESLFMGYNLCLSGQAVKVNMTSMTNYPALLVTMTQGGCAMTNIGVAWGVLMKRRRLVIALAGLIEDAAL